MSAALKKLFKEPQDKVEERPMEDAAIEVETKKDEPSVRRILRERKGV
jgi:hypothetical protein